MFCFRTSTLNADAISGTAPSNPLSLTNQSQARQFRIANQQPNGPTITRDKKIWGTSMTPLRNRGHNNSSPAEARTLAITVSWCWYVHYSHPISLPPRITTDMKFLQRIGRAQRAAPVRRLASHRAPPRAQARAFTTTQGCWQTAFHAQSDTENAAASAILGSVKSPPKVPQTLTEKIVQRYSVGLPEGKYVKSGDYVTLRPQFKLAKKS